MRSSHGKPQLAAQPRASFRVMAMALLGRRLVRWVRFVVFLLILSFHSMPSITGSLLQCRNIIEVIHWTTLNLLHLSTLGRIHAPLEVRLLFPVPCFYH